MTRARDWDVLGWLLAATAGGSLLAVALGGRPPAAPGPPPPRAAALLAFHEAQDRLDVHAMLRAAERMDGLGEAALAGDLRRLTREVARLAATTGR